MTNIIHFQYDAVENIVYEKIEGHYFLHLPAFFSTDGHANALISFVLDTGAYLTVISRDTATRFGFDKIPPINTNLPLSGFAGGCNADLVEIPGLIVGGRMLEGVKVAIPQEINGINLLGLNILEYFNYLIDSNNSKIYFAMNDNYKIPEILKCAKVRAISSH